MGIPSLSKALTSLRHRLEFLCISSAPNEWVFLVDGPSLVYWIYYQICQQNLCKGALSGLDAQPSYSEICGAVERWLCRLREWGSCVVLWDGELPVSKRPVRLERMRKVVADLAGLRRAEPNGFRLSKAMKQQASYASFEGLAFRYAAPTNNKQASLSPFQLPAPPFMIPACREALARSHPEHDWAIQVPGEADAWLAAWAREYSEVSKEQQEPSKVLVFSEDSDLAAHDLGDAYLAPFSSIEKPACSQHDLKRQSCYSFQVQALHQLDFLDEVGSMVYGRPEETRHKDWLVALFQFSRRFGRGKQLPSLWGLYTEALTGEFDDELASDPVLAKAFGEFEQEHAAYIEWGSDGQNHEVRLRRWLQQQSTSTLDVRLNELVVHMDPGKSTLSAPAHVYLPPLLEDCDRTTALNVSRRVRVLAYGILATKFHCEKTRVFEFGRSGMTVNHHEIILKDRVDDQFLQTELGRLERAYELVHQHTSPTASPAIDVDSARSWMILALAEIYTWHQETGKKPPKWDVIHRSITYFDHPKKTIERADWPRLQLLAMMHSYLYSLRMLQQILDMSSPVHETSTGFQLFPALQELPPLTSLILMPRNMPDLALSEDNFMGLVGQLCEMSLKPAEKDEGASEARDGSQDIEMQDESHIDSADETSVSEAPIRGSRFALLTNSG